MWRLTATFLQDFFIINNYGSRDTRSSISKKIEDPAFVEAEIQEERCSVSNKDGDFALAFTGLRLFQKIEWLI